MKKINFFVSFVLSLLISFPVFASVITDQVADSSDSVFNTSNVSEQTSAVNEAEEKMEFPDLSTHWSLDFVGTLYEKNIVKGKSDGMFHPDDFITRAELTKIAILAYDYEVLEKVSEKPFSDVEISAWYAPYIAKAKEVGLIGGYKDGTFRPNANISRAEALKILVEGVFYKDFSNLKESDMSFTDVEKGAWYKDYIEFAYLLDIVKGYPDNTFRPNAYITRAEASKILIKLMEN